MMNEHIRSNYEKIIKLESQELHTLKLYLADLDPHLDGHKMISAWLMNKIRDLRISILETEIEKLNRESNAKKED